MKMHDFAKIVCWTLACAVMTEFASAQAPTPTLNAVSPPTVSTDPNYGDFNSYVIPSPVVNGVTVAIPWNAVDMSTTSAQDYQFSTWDSQNLTQFENITPAKVVNFIVMPAEEGGVNRYTPDYVFSQAWANGTVPWESPIPGWAAQTPYLPSTYILVNGSYQQEIATVTPPSGFNGHCVSGKKTPNFSTTVGGTVNDGTAPTQCTWQDVGTNAPLQQMANCQSYEGAPQWQGTTTYGNGVVIAPNEQDFNFHYYQQSSGKQCLSNGTPPSSWNTSGGYTSDNNCSWLDIGTAIPNDQGIPVSYNLPMMSAYQKFAAALYNHYATSPPSGFKVGYIRFGMTEGGEASPLCNTANSQSSGWPEYSKYTYLAYISDMTNYFGGLGTTNPAQTADMHMVGNPGDPDYADQEALYAFNNSIGIGTNGLSANDVLNLTGGTGYTQLCSTTPQGCTSGDWYYNFDVVPVGTGTGYCGQTMNNGYHPICSLQTQTYSTPTDNTPPNTGSLSAITTSPTFPGLIPTAQTYGATNLEIYPIDTLLATSPNYCNDVGASCGSGSNYSVFQPNYEATFESFLSQTPGIYDPAANTTLSSDTSVTFYWYPESTATAYRLVVSSSSGGGGTIYYTNSTISQWNSSQTATMSLPHGATVYAHLAYELSGVWTVISVVKYTAP
jgi:hypothetical protein